MATYVFSLGLIPVQEWIAQARRSRDLKAGSAILCRLTAGALEALGTEGIEILLPRPPEGHTFADLACLETALTADYGIPNRVSGYLEAGSVEVAACRLESATRGTLRTAWTTLCVDLLRPSPGASSWERGFWASLAEPLRIYLASTAGGEDCPFSFVWVVALAGPREDRRGNLQRIDRLYADVKRSRPVRPALLGSPVGKCNQCGARDAIGPTASFDAWRDWYQRLGELPWIERGFRLDPGERLCYVCLARRIAGYSAGGDFPSTGLVAAGPWLERARQDGKAKEHLAALAATRAGRADLARVLHASPGQLERTDASPGAPETGDGALTARHLRDLRARLKALPDLGLPPQPPAYLALLTFDGDDMGRRVQSDPEGVPERMARFSVSARALLRRALAEPFYLAGDEGLAMAPAATALDLAVELREVFRTVFGDAITLSMGIAFFEQTRPLVGAIRAARAALEDAKRLDGKNGLGVTVQTASGNLWSLAETWGPFWERLRSAVGLVREGELAAGWAHDVEAFLAALPEDEWRAAGVPDAASAEVKRLFVRRLRSVAGERRRARGERLWAELAGTTWWPEEGGRLRRSLPEQFHLIGFLARQAVPVSDTPSEPPSEATA